MKKNISLKETTVFLSLLILSFLLTACDSAPENTETETPQPPVETPPPSTTPLEITPPKEAPELLLKRKKDEDEDLEEELLGVQTEGDGDDNALDMTPQPLPKGVYNDGTATIDQQYLTPGSEEDSVGVSVTVTNDAITDVKITVKGKHSVSKELQSSFAQEIGAVVKGKKLESITDLDAVGGASLTTGAFLKALETIKKQQKK